jgi:hypothetical protein
MTGEWSDDDRLNREIAILREDFRIEDDRLYRITRSNSKRRNVTTPVLTRLCVPLNFRRSILRTFHDLCAHYSIAKTFETARLYVYWKSLYQSVTDYVKSCDVCNRIKPANKQVPPLNHVPITPCGGVWAIDHLILPKTTLRGSVGLLIMVDLFSGLTLVESCRTMTALQTAHIIVKRIISMFSIPFAIQSDKSLSYINNLWKAIGKALNFCHFSGSSVNPRANGIAEIRVKAVKHGLAVYSKSDITADESLPLIELALNTTVQKSTGLSAFNIMFGRLPRLAVNGYIDPEQKTLPQGQAEYYSWLVEKLQLIHENVEKNIQEARSSQKQFYDKRNKVTTPDWYIGQLVYLLDRRPEKGQILKKQIYKAPMYIVDIIQKTRNEENDESELSFKSVLPPS